METQTYQAYLSVLKEELIPAMGCTEPIAIAYAGAVARQTLGILPTRIEVYASPNIIKNVKSVVVPNTGGKKGIASAAAAGIITGDAEAKLQVLANMSKEQIEELDVFLKEVSCVVAQSENPFLFDIVVRAYHGEDCAEVEIAGFHTNIIKIRRNETSLLEINYTETKTSGMDHSFMSVEGIVEFADQAKIEDIKDTLDRQIACNTAIADEGMKSEWGARIGKTLIQSYGSSVHNKAKAYTAAGSDARMNGCELPVVINSGSGNQGLTASLPVITYARELHVSDETLYRALLVSNLVTIHLKTGIGRLSAYCGATSAGCGAGAGICYLHGGKEDEVSHTVVNALAINSGMICDGAKSSCAAKIASAVEAGLLGWQMQRQGTQFYGGDGIIVKGVENTIRNVGRMARLGMAQTDREIISIMMDQ